MRRPLALIVLALAASFGSLGTAHPVQAAAARTPAKVVIVVGATHAATATYRSYADAAYAEAIKYTPNVVKVYSPNATWSKVKSAAVGASILIYFGHGNGWPSPYAYDPAYTTKDGMGLNADLNGDGKLSDYENKYYGEPYVKTLDLAPNAIVLLHHLCYASGNSEPGQPQPTVTVARQRISNYAAGFLASPAQAVLADGRRGPVDYIRALFTTDQAIEAMWRSAPGNNGNASSFTSTRTSGVRALMDPEGTSSGFYRSLVTHPTLTTNMVVGTVDTSRDPAALVVPGRAAVRTEGAPLFSDAATAAVGAPESGIPQPAGTRLIVTATSGAGLVDVDGLDDPAIHGTMRITDLIPKDSAPPRVLAVDPTSAVFSPNADEVADTLTVTSSLSETASWRVRFRDADGATVHEVTGEGREPTGTWDGAVEGTPVAEGTYSYRIDASDAWGNAGYKTGTITVDLSGPTLTSVSPAEDAATWFSPNGDGVRDTVALGGTVSERGSVAVHVRDAGGALIRSYSVPTATSIAALTWDGKDSGGATVPDGEYDIRLTPRDAVANAGEPVTRQVTAIGFLRAVTSSKSLFYPQDRDALSTGTRLSFTLARPATVTWTIRNAAGTVVATLLDGAEVAAGTTSRMWYGTSDAGVSLPTGRYTAVVNARDTVLAATQAVAVEMNAFGIRPSASSVTRGRSITLTVTSAESLDRAPRVYVTQPGVTTWAVTLAKVSGLTYKATLKMKTGGRSGTVTFKVQAPDANGRYQRTSLSLPLH